MSTPETAQQVSTILIVDDDEGVTQTFARMLTLEGFHVRTAFNAESGLRAANEAHPNAIILDLRMPLVDGLGFLRQLRSQAGQRQAPTPVAIVTGDYSDDAVASGCGSWAPSAIRPLARGSNRPRPQPAEGDAH